MAADHNHEEGFPQSFSNQNRVSFRPGAGDSSGMAGMILPGNPGTPSNTSSVLPLPGNPPGNINRDPVHPLIHGPPLAVHWSHDELLLLRQGLVAYANESNLMKCIKIAAKLPNKTVRDVAMRCRWMAEKMVDSCSTTSMHSVQPGNMIAYSLPMHRNTQPSREASPINSETRRLLIENSNLLNQIACNFEVGKVQDNINLFYRARDNIKTISKRLSGMSGIMSRMPPLPVSINEKLFQSIFPLADQVHAPDSGPLNEDPRHR